MPKTRKTKTKANRDVLSNEFIREIALVCFHIGVVFGRTYYSNATGTRKRSKPRKVQRLARTPKQPL